MREVTGAQEATLSTLGGQIKYRRQQAGRGLVSFARDVGTVPSNLQSIEACATVPSVYLAARIAHALSTTVDELLSHQPEGRRHDAAISRGAGGATRA